MAGHKEYPSSCSVVWCGAVVNDYVTSPFLVFSATGRYFICFFGNRNFAVTSHSIIRKPFRYYIEISYFILNILYIPYYPVHLHYSRFFSLQEIVGINFLFAVNNGSKRKDYLITNH